MNDSRIVVITPAGKPLVKLTPSIESEVLQVEDFTDEDLLQWASANQEKNASGRLSIEALRYWLQYTFDPNSPEYRALRDRLVGLLENSPEFPS